MIDLRIMRHHMARTVFLSRIPVGLIFYLHLRLLGVTFCYKSAARKAPLLWDRSSFGSSFDDFWIAGLVDTDDDMNVCLMHISAI